MLVPQVKFLNFKAVFLSVICPSTKKKKNLHFCSNYNVYFYMTNIFVTVFMLLWIVPTINSTANHSLSFTSPFPYHQQSRGSVENWGFGWGKSRNEGFLIELMIEFQMAWKLLEKTCLSLPKNGLDCNQHARVASESGLNQGFVEGRHQRVI